MIYLQDQEFKLITTYIKINYGVDLTKKRPLIEGRLSNHLIHLGFTNYMDYFAYAKKDASGEEMSVMINKLTTNHTYFLRENEHFAFYQQTILPWIEDELGEKDLRIWSAGCSSGQEPYTLVMTTLNYLGSKAESWDCSILASDISQKVLQTAREGSYAQSEMDQIPRSWLKRYFRPLGPQRFIVSDELRKNVSFRHFNLLSPFHFKKPFQTIFCRNVMIYFDLPTKNEVIRKFYDALLPGGYLLIGHSESLSGCDHQFHYIQPSIYRKK